jgi:hypothetical protein
LSADGGSYTFTTSYAVLWTVKDSLGNSVATGTTTSATSKTLTLQALESYTITVTQTGSKLGNYSLDIKKN